MQWFSTSFHSSGGKMNLVGIFKRSIDWKQFWEKLIQPTASLSGANTGFTNRKINYLNINNINNIKYNCCNIGWQTVFPQNRFSHTMSMNSILIHILKWPTRHLMYSTAVHTCSQFFFDLMSILFKMFFIITIVKCRPPP